MPLASHGGKPSISGYNGGFAKPVSYVSPMARPLRIEYPNAVYHTTARGNAREDVFLDDGDRRLFLGLLAETIARFRRPWICG